MRARAAFVAVGGSDDPVLLGAAQQTVDGLTVRHVLDLLDCKKVKELEFFRMGSFIKAVTQFWIIFDPPLPPSLRIPILSP